jgi:hypothetical protein
MYFNAAREFGNTYVSSNTQGTALERYERRLAARTSTTGSVSILRIHSSSKSVVDGFRNHHGCGDIRLDVKDSASILKQCRQRRVGLGRVADVGCEADG